MIETINLVPTSREFVKPEICGGRTVQVHCTSQPVRKHSATVPGPSINTGKPLSSSSSFKLYENTARQFSKLYFALKHSAAGPTFERPHAWLRDMRYKPTQERHEVRLGEKGNERERQGAIRVAMRSQIDGAASLKAPHSRPLLRRTSLVLKPHPGNCPTRKGRGGGSRRFECHYLTKTCPLHRGEGESSDRKKGRRGRKKEKRERKKEIKKREGGRSGYIKGLKRVFI